MLSASTTAVMGHADGPAEACTMSFIAAATQPSSLTALSGAAAACKATATGIGSAGVCVLGRARLLTVGCPSLGTVMKSKMDLWDLLVDGALRFSVEA